MPPYRLRIVYKMSLLSLYFGSISFREPCAPQITRFTIKIKTFSNKVSKLQ